jgi:hypothetical protein
MDGSSDMFSHNKRLVLKLFLQINLQLEGPEAGQELMGGEVSMHEYLPPH